MQTSGAQGLTADQTVPMRPRSQRQGLTEFVSVAAGQFSFSLCDATGTYISSLSWFVWPPGWTLRRFALSDETALLRVEREKGGCWVCLGDVVLLAMKETWSKHANCILDAARATSNQPDNIAITRLPRSGLVGELREPQWQVRQPCKIATSIPLDLLILRQTLRHCGIGGQYRVRDAAHFTSKCTPIRAKSSAPRTLPLRRARCACTSTPLLQCQPRRGRTVTRRKVSGS